MSTAATLRWSAASRPTGRRVSILQVAGSTDTMDDILKAEQLWKAKLETGAFGLTRN